MAWSKFTKSHGGSRPKTSNTISVRNYVGTISREVCEQFPVGTTKVSIFVDEEKRRIGFKAAKETDREAYQLEPSTGGGACYSSATLCRKYGNFRSPVYKEGDYFIIDIPIKKRRRKKLKK